MLLLHVFFVLLKIIGILLAVLVGIVVLLLAAPIRYSFQINRRENALPEAKIKVTWLWIVVGFKASYIEKMFDYRVRIFGYQILGNQKEFIEKKQKREKEKEIKKRKKEEKQQTEKREPEELQALSLPEEDTILIEQELASNPKNFSSKKENMKAKTAVSSEKKEKKQKKTRKHKTRGKKKKKRSNRISSMKETMHKVKTAYQEYHGEQLLDFAKKSIIKILKHVLPRKMQGYLRFGFEDPAITGVVTGFAAMFYPKYQKQFSLEPDFQKECFEAEWKGRGRIHPGFFLYIVLTAFLDRDVRNVIKLIKEV